jgi:tripartite ATP-independent transporter DctM subunit
VGLENLIIPLIALVVVLIAIGVPIYVSMGLSASLILILSGEFPLNIIGQRLFAGADSFALLAVPFFLLAGNIMIATRMSQTIVDFAAAVVGPIRGGLSMVSVLSCGMFASMTGSSIADSAAVGNVVIPGMKRQGYRPEFAASVVATAGILGGVIPPSVPFIIYATMANQSVATLLVAGIIPGVLIMLGLMLLCYFHARKENHPRLPRLSAAEFLRAFWKALPALLTPVIILGAIFLGIVTVTEAAVLAVLYATFVGVVVYRNLGWSEFWTALRRTADTTAVVMILIASATVFSWALTGSNAARHVADLILGFTDKPLVVLLIINIIFLIAGLALEMVPVMTMLVPILLPIALEVGIDPIHFGVITVVNLAIGVASPPSAPNLVVAAEIAKVPLGRASIAVIPFLAVEVAVLLLVTYLPQSYMWLVEFIG